MKKEITYNKKYAIIKLCNDENCHLTQKEVAQVMEISYSMLRRILRYEA